MNSHGGIFTIRFLFTTFLRPSCDGAATPFWLQDPFQFKTTQGQLGEKFGTIRSLPRHEIHQPLAGCILLFQEGNPWITTRWSFFAGFNWKFESYFLLSRWIIPSYYLHLFFAKIYLPVCTLDIYWMGKIWLLNSEFPRFFRPFLLGFNLWPAAVVMNVGL